MIPFLLIFQIPRIYPILLITTRFFISIIITIPECATFHQQVWNTNSDGSKLITVLPNILRLSEKLEHISIAQNNDQVMIDFC